MTGDVDSTSTQPFLPGSTVNYRCTCGHDCNICADAGGDCPNCGRAITSKVLHYDMSATLMLKKPAAEGAAPASEVPSAAGEPLVDPPEQCGKCLGHFEIVDLLGQGGMAQVYRALDRSLQRYVAVKVLKPQRGLSGATPTTVDRLLQEAVSQARVNHPNIVSIYYVGNEDGKRFMAMELVNGEPLSQRIADQGPLPFDEVASIGLQISSALQASARLDLMHGDIKPSNILWQENGIAKLSDFGLARSTVNRTSESMGGTPNYLAPELLSGKAPSIQSDMYSLGVTLFELSFGKLPKSLTGTSVTEWAAVHQLQPISFPSQWPQHMPAEWRKILQRLLAARPEDRYADYETLISELAAIMPVKQQPARMFPRLFAFGIDFFILKPVIDLSLLVMAMLLGQARALLQFSEPMALRWWSKDMPWYIDLVSLLTSLVTCAAFAAVPLAYLIWVGYWGQSPGRTLMHLRVVNRYGLTPRPRQLAIREAMRMIVALASVPIAIGLLWSVPTWPLLSVFLGLPLVFSAIDCWWLISSRIGRSLHDRWLQTSVVLDTR